MAPALMVSIVSSATASQDTLVLHVRLSKIHVTMFHVIVVNVSEFTALTNAAVALVIWALPVKSTLPFV